MNQFLGGVATGVIGQAVIEVVVDNSGLDASLTKTQKLLAGAAVSGAAAATVAALSYETAMAGVQKTTNANAEQMRDLNQLFRDQSREIPMSASALAGLGATAAQLGVEVEDLGTFTETIAKLGTATNIMGEQGAMDLARFINVVGESTDNVDRIGSAIVDLGNNSQTTEREILSMALRTAAAGRQLRLSTGDVLGLATAASSLGLEAEAGGTALSRVILDIYANAQKGTGALKLHAQVAGMTAEQYAEMVRSSPMEALTAFIGGLGTAEERGLNVITMLDDMSLGNIRVRDALLRLSGAQELVTDAVDLGNRAYAENSALQKEFDLFAETGVNQLKLLANQFLNLGIVAGTMTIPVLKQVADILQLLLGGFTDLPGQVQLMALALLSVVTLGGPLNAMLSLTWTNLRRLQALVLAGPGAWKGLALSMGPAGFLGVLVAVGLTTDLILQKTTGHGLIDWLFRDPRTADAAARAVGDFNAKLEVLGAATNAEERYRLTREEIARVAEQYDRASAAHAAFMQQIGVSTVTSHQRDMKEYKATIEGLVQSLVEAGAPFEVLHGLVVSLDGELAETARNAIPNYDARLHALMGTLDATEDILLLNSRASREAAAANNEAATGVDNLGKSLLDLNPRIMATAAGMELIKDLANSNPLAMVNFFRRVSQIRRVQSMQAGVEAMTDWILGGSDRNTGGGAGGAGGGGASATPVGRLNDEFREFGERAPKAIREAQAELLLYREAAVRAGDTTRRDLIDRLLTLDPTVSQIRSAISGLQAEYGDLAAGSVKAIEEMEAALERLGNLAQREGDRIRGLQVDIFRDLTRQGVDPMLSLQFAQSEQLRVLRQREAEVTAALQVGTIDVPTANRIFRDLREGSPDQFREGLGLSQYITINAPDNSPAAIAHATTMGGLELAHQLKAEGY